MESVLVAIRDHNLRHRVRLLLEEAGYSVLEAHNNLTAFTALHISPSPLVVLLDAHLDEGTAAEQLLRLARAGGPAGRHRYVICMTPPATSLSPSLMAQIMTANLSVLQEPFELEALVRLVARPHLILPPDHRPPRSGRRPSESVRQQRRQTRRPSLPRAGRSRCMAY
jgi:CheY-like chemotaxis protein